MQAELKTIWIVDTEDGETEYFSTKEKARKYADDWAIVYAEECKISLVEAADMISIWSQRLDTYVG